LIPRSKIRGVRRGSFRKRICFSRTLSLCFQVERRLRYVPKERGRCLTNIKFKSKNRALVLVVALRENGAWVLKHGPIWGRGKVDSRRGHTQGKPITHGHEEPANDSAGSTSGTFQGSQETHHAQTADRQRRRHETLHKWARARGGGKHRVVRDTAHTLTRQRHRPPRRHAQPATARGGVRGGGQPQSQT
jgi:hypothetical protein